MSWVLEKCFVIALFLAFSGCFVHADNYPNKPLSVVVGFGVGGSADRMARAVSPYLAKELGQPVQVINRKGAGTLLASNYVLGKPHDGYTLYASTFSPYLSNTILEGGAKYTVDDFAYVNFQWFDEELIALSKRSKFKSFQEVLEAISAEPKTVRASCVRGSSGHLMIKLMLTKMGIPPENLNLVAYNSGGQARAAVAGGVVDFIIISAKGSESIREYLNPQAIISPIASEEWAVPTINEVLKPFDIEIPLIPGSIRGFATTAEFKKSHPERFEKLTNALQRTLRREDLSQLLDQADIGRRWTGPDASQKMMQESFGVISQYSHLLNQ